jgi:uncharacterized protein
MDSTKNEQLIRRYMDAFAHGDLARAAQAFADEAVWHLPGKSLVAGDYRGRDAIMGMFGKVFELCEGKFRIDLVDVMASGDHAVQWQRLHAERKGKTLDLTEAVVCRIVGDRIVEVFHRTEESILDPFFS